MAIDLLSIARTGVMASQAQLGVTSNNIANVNTEGYSRQVATQASYEPQRLGSSYYGTGSYVSDVKRIYSEFASRELRIGQTALSAAETTYNKLSELDQLYSQVGTMIPNGLNDFFSGINSIADLPADVGMRIGALGSAEQLAKSINQIQAHLDDKVKQTNLQIQGISTRISEISKEIGNINLEIMESEGNNNNFLLDKQDALILELSQYSQVSVIPMESGAKSIMLGGSFMLVSAEVSMKMGVSPGNPFPNEPQMTAVTGDKTLAINPEKLGGQIGALFAFRDETLLTAQKELGQLALGLADTFNQMQSRGFDLNGNIGEPIFTDINDPVMSSGRVGIFATNTGSAALSVKIDDVGLLTGRGYELSLNGSPSTYQLKDTQTGNIQTLSLNGANELVGGDGFTINITSGSMAVGDRFEIRPTAGAASGFAMIMTDPKGFAAAGPKIIPNTANSGSNQLALKEMDASVAGFPGVNGQMTFAINSSTAPPTYEAFNALGVSVATGSAVVTGSNTPPEISVFGLTFSVTSNAVATDDRFTFDLSFAEGNNSNAVEMAKLVDAKLMNNGTSTLNGVYEGSKQTIGTKTKSAEVRLGAADIVHKQAYERMQSESGVNLDEEAANLIRFQQSYQASARIMSTAQAIFDTLFQSVR